MLLFSEALIPEEQKQIGAFKPTMSVYMLALACHVDGRCMVFLPTIISII